VSSGIVTNWSESRPGQPYATVGISCCAWPCLPCISCLPMLQQAIIDLGGMQPRTVSSLILLPAGNWWNYPPSPFSARFSSMLAGCTWPATWPTSGFWHFRRTKAGNSRNDCAVSDGGALANVIVALQLGNLDAPIIGASGAISAVVGAYLGLFRRDGLVCSCHLVCISSLHRFLPARHRVVVHTAVAFIRSSAPLMLRSRGGLTWRALPSGSALHFSIAR